MKHRDFIDAFAWATCIALALAVFLVVYYGITGEVAW